MDTVGMMLREDILDFGGGDIYAWNDGGGGGGSGSGTGSGTGTGGAGGSGVVIISYPSSNTDLISIGAGLTYSKTTSGGNTIYTFTAGTGSINW